MKKILFAFAAIATIATLAFTVGDPLTIGSSMPKATLKMKDVSGKEVAMKDAAKENGVLVMFSCYTCPYVVKNQERTRAISEYAIKMKVGVIILNSNEAYRGNEDSFDSMKDYADGQGYKWSMLVDVNQRNNVKGSDGQYSDMVKMYVSQDINKLIKSIKEESGDVSGFEDKLLIERNKNWIPQIIEGAKTQSTFYVVGAGHLAGPNGM